MDLVEVPLPSRRGRTSMDLRDVTRQHANDKHHQQQHPSLSGPRRRGVPNGGVLRVPGNEKFFTWHAANNYSRLELSEWSMQCASAGASSQHALDLQFEEGDLAVPGAATVLMLPTRDGSSPVVCCCVVSPQSVVHLVRFIRRAQDRSTAGDNSDSAVVFAGASRGGRTLPPKVITSRHELFGSSSSADASTGLNSSATPTTSGEQPHGPASWQITCASWSVRAGDGALVLSVGRPDGSVACAVFRDPLGGPEIGQAPNSAVLQQRIAGPKPQVRMLHDKSMVRQFLRRVVSSATGHSSGNNKHSGEYIAAITCFSPWNGGARPDPSGGESGGGVLVLSLGADSRLRIWSVDHATCIYRMELAHSHDTQRQRHQQSAGAGGDGADVHGAIESAAVNVRRSPANNGEFYLTIVCQFAAAPPTSFLFAGVVDADNSGLKFTRGPTRFVEESCAVGDNNNNDVRSFFGMAICDVAHCGDHVLTLWRDDNSASAATIVRHSLLAEETRPTDDDGDDGRGGMMPKAAVVAMMVDPQPEEWVHGDLRIRDLTVEDQVHEYGKRRLGLPGRFVPQAILESAQRSLGCKLHVPVATAALASTTTSGETTTPLPDTLENLTVVIAAVAQHIRTCAQGGAGNVNPPRRRLVVAHQLWSILLQDCARVARERTLPVALCMDTAALDTQTASGIGGGGGLHLVVRTGALSLLRTRLPVEQVSSNAAAVDPMQLLQAMNSSSSSDSGRKVVAGALAALATTAFEANADLLRRALDGAMEGGQLPHHRQRHKGGGGGGGPRDLYAWVHKRAGQVDADTLQDLDRFVGLACAQLAPSCGGAPVSLAEALHECVRDVLESLGSFDFAEEENNRQRSPQHQQRGGGPSPAAVSPLLCEAVTHALVQVASAGSRVACGLVLVLALLRYGVHAPLSANIDDSERDGAHVGDDTAGTYANALLDSAELSAQADSLAAMACGLAHAFGFIQHARAKTCSTRRQLFEFPALVLAPVSSGGGGGGGGASTGSIAAATTTTGTSGGSSGSASGERERASLVRLLLDRQGGLNDMVSRQRAELVVSTLHVVVARVLAMQPVDRSQSQGGGGASRVSFLTRLYTGLAASLACFTASVPRVSPALTLDNPTTRGHHHMGTLVHILRGAFELELVVSFVRFVLGMGGLELARGTRRCIPTTNAHEQQDHDGVLLVPEVRTMLLTGAEAQLQLVLESREAQNNNNNNNNNAISPLSFTEEVDDVLRVLHRCAPPKEQYATSAGSAGDVTDSGVEYLVSLAKYLDTLGLSRHATRLAFVALSRLDDVGRSNQHEQLDTTPSASDLNLRSVLWANIFAFSTRGVDPDFRLALSAIVAQTDTNKRAQFLRQLIVLLLDREQYECILSLPLSRDADLHASAVDLIKQRAQYTPPRYALASTTAQAQLAPASCYHLWFAMCMKVGAFVDAAEAMLRLARHHERAFAPVLLQQQQQQQQQQQGQEQLLTIARARAEALGTAVMALQLVAPHDAVLVLGSGSSAAVARDDVAGSSSSGGAGNGIATSTTMIHAVGLSEVQREFVLADALARLAEQGETPRVWTFTGRQDVLLLLRQLLDVQLVEVAAGLCASEKLDMEPFGNGSSGSNGGGNGDRNGEGGGVFTTLTDMCVDSGCEEGAHWDLLRALLERFDQTTTSATTLTAVRGGRDDEEMDDQASGIDDDATAANSCIATLPTFRYHAVVLDRLLLRRGRAARLEGGPSSSRSDGDTKPVPLWLLRSFQRWAQFSRRHKPDENAFAAGRSHPALCAKLMLQHGMLKDACELVTEMLPMYEDVKSWWGVVVEPPWIPTSLIDQLIGACNRFEREQRTSERAAGVAGARKALEARTGMVFAWIVEQQPFRNASYLGNLPT